MYGSSTWHPRKHIVRADIPANLRPWLVDPRSLTRRIRRACPAVFSLRLLRQRWERPLLDEAIELSMPTGQFALIRQVFLLCDGRPWVFARTVIPHRTLRGGERRLANLGNRPLGALLFSDRTMRRGEVKVCEVRPGQPLFALASAGLGRRPKAAWARRSTFVLRQKPLLVSEVFLPDLVDRSDVFLPDLVEWE